MWKTAAVQALAGTHVRESVVVSYADARYTQTFTEDGFVERQGRAVGIAPLAAWNVAASVEYSVPLSGGAVALTTPNMIARFRHSSARRYPGFIVSKLVSVEAPR